MGKWIFYLPSESIDASWEVLVGLVSDQKIIQAKTVSRRGAIHGNHLVCVYVPDYTVEAEVARVAHLLRESLPHVNLVGFKADITTYMGIESHNLHGVDIFFYRVAGSGIRRTVQQNQVPPPDPGRIYLRVAFDEREEAKGFGARWDPERRLWYFPAKVAEEHTREQRILAFAWVASMNGPVEADIYLSHPTDT